MEKTLSIIKPDGTKRNLIGKIVGKFEENGIKIAAMKMKWLSRREAESFYSVHQDRPFFGELVDMMISGPVLVMVLAGESVIAKNREIMGATDPSKADTGTIRQEFALSIGENTVHGSDSPETAVSEIAFFFSESEIVN